MSVRSPRSPTNPCTSTNDPVDIEAQAPLKVFKIKGAKPKGNGFAHVDYVKVKNNKLDQEHYLLHSMNILFPESKVTAIFGPSGSGKSTLLNFVTGSLENDLTAEGVVHLNGKMGFVPQDDRLHGFYTCRSYVEHYSRLTGATDNFANAQDSKDLLVSLGMDGHADTIVGDIFRKGLSGGQKRRLSIALEALSSPETLCLDEPTSGEKKEQIPMQIARE